MLNLGIGLGLSGGAGGAGVVLGASEFYAPLTHSLVLTRGTGDPTYSRATNAWEFDNEGKPILVPSGAARFGGARMVRNLLTYTEDFSNAAWNVTGSASKAGETINCTAIYDALVQTITVNAVAGSVYTASFWLTGSGVVSIKLLENTGSYSATTGTAVTLSATPQLVSVTKTITQSLVPTVKVYIQNNVASTCSFTGYGQLENVTGQADQTASEYVSVGVLSAPFHGAGVDGVKWYDTNKDGSAISASSLLGYHAEGARTNNLLYSRDLRNINYGLSTWNVQGTVGPELLGNGDFSSSTGWSLPSGVTISGGKLDVSGAATNTAYKAGVLTVGKTYVLTFTIDSITAGSVRTWSGFNGVARTTAGTYTTTVVVPVGADGTCGLNVHAGPITAVIDNFTAYEAAIQVTTCTGIDNAPNSASTLTASAADATILQTLTMAAAARSFSAYVKRRTGTGSVYITRDGGTNWTDITSSLGASWTRVKIENTSVLNPSVGFKIATSGDAIDVDVCQDESGAFITSPIITTTAAVTRNEDRLLYQKASNLLDTSGSALCSWCINDDGTTYVSQSRNALVVDTNGRMIRGASGADVTTANIYDGVNSITSTGGAARNNSTHKKAAAAWESATAKVITQGGLLASGSYDGTMGAGSNIDVGGNASGSTLFGHIKNVYIWSTALTDAQLQQVTV